MNALQSKKTFAEAGVEAELTITRIPALVPAPHVEGVVRIGAAMVRVERLSVELQLTTPAGRIYSATHADAGARELLLTFMGLALEHQADLVKEMHAWVLDQLKVTTVRAEAAS